MKWFFLDKMEIERYLASQAVEGLGCFGLGVYPSGGDDVWIARAILHNGNPMVCEELFNTSLQAKEACEKFLEFCIKHKGYPEGWEYDHHEYGLASMENEFSLVKV